jgi:hypothetical protein
MSGTATQTTHIWRPSNARCLAIDGFAPVPRGTAPAAPVPLAWPAKDPGDVLDYQLDFAAALAGNAGDAIAGLNVSVTPGGTGDLAVRSAAADGALAVLWLAGGQAGTVYTVQVAATTLSGRVIARAVFLPVLSLTTPVAPSAALLTEQGAIVTDQNGNPILLGS